MGHEQCVGVIAPVIGPDLFMVYLVNVYLWFMIFTMLLNEILFTLSIFMYMKLYLL